MNNIEPRFGLFLCLNQQLMLKKLIYGKIYRGQQLVKKIIINTSVKKMLADMYTPVGIYLRLRDRFS
jgi:hypothetical protein